LVLVEHCHDLPDHVAHRIVAELLSDRDEPDTILGEALDIKLSWNWSRKKGPKPRIVSNAGGMAIVDGFSLFLYRTH
jgi:hypothetical protein